MIVLPDIPVDSTFPFAFDTYDSDGASVTITGLAVTDVEVYKDGSTTQRASDNGVSLLDTDGIDFDGSTGLHGFSIDFSDNSDAGFYAADSFYWVHVNAITVDSQTVRFTYCFRLVNPVATAADLATVDSNVDAIKVVSDAIGATAAANLNTVFNTNFSTVYDGTNNVLLARLTGSVTHGDSTAKLRLGASGSTPGLHVTSSVNNVPAVRFTEYNGFGSSANLGIDCSAMYVGTNTITWNSSWSTQVQSASNDALEALHLDHLLAVDYDPDSKPGTTTALLNELVSSNSGVSIITGIGAVSDLGSGADLASNLADMAGSGFSNSTDTLEDIRDNQPGTAAAIADAVWDEATADHTGSGSTGEAVAASGVSAATIADAVWDEATAGHTSSGTMGLAVGTSGASASAVADAVWDELLTDHTTSGTFGGRWQEGDRYSNTDANIKYITRGDTYDDTANDKLSWAVTKDFTSGWTGTMTIRHRTEGTSLMSATVTAASAVLLEATLTTTETAFALLTSDDDFGPHPYDVEMVSGSSEQTIIKGVAVISKDYTEA